MPDSQREREKAICSCLAKPRRMPRRRRPPPARRREPGAGGEAVGGHCTSAPAALGPGAVRRQRRRGGRRAVDRRRVAGWTAARSTRPSPRRRDRSRKSARRGPCLPTGRRSGVSGVLRRRWLRLNSGYSSTAPSCVCYSSVANQLLWIDYLIVFVPLCAGAGCRLR